jgi:hypothetical protein
MGVTREVGVLWVTLTLESMWLTEKSMEWGEGR